MSEPVLTSEYQTDVMPLVAYLMHEGFTPQLTELDQDERRCYWVFILSKPLSDAIDRFHSGEARVEPKNFSAMFHRISRERARLLRK